MMTRTMWPRRASAWASGTMRAENVALGCSPNGASSAIRMGYYTAWGGRARDDCRHINHKEHKEHEGHEGIYWASTSRKMFVLFVLFVIRSTGMVVGVGYTVSMIDVYRERAARFKAEFDRETERWNRIGNVRLLAFFAAAVG